MMLTMMSTMMSKKKKIGEKKAVLIGLKHPQMKDSDVVKNQILRMKKFLMDLRGFSEDNITLLIEEEEEEEEESSRRYQQPTEINIMSEAASLVEFANPGDTLFIHIIAHGCSNFSITTSDKQFIPDHQFRAIIHNAVRKGCTLTIVSDCLIEPVAENSVCCSWGIPIVFPQDSARFCGKYKGYTSTFLSQVDILNPKEEDEDEEDEEETKEEDDVASKLSGLLKSIFMRKKKSSLPNSRVILLNAFQGDQKAEDPNPKTPELFFPLPNKHGLLYGGFTSIILDIIEETQGRVTNVELVQKAMEKLRMQPAGLHCNDHHHAYAPFCAD